MSITLADVLRLPSMAGAEVLSGHNSLLQPVESINVLEYAEISDELEQFFSSNHYEGSELIITAFANIRNDIETQCENIRRYHSIGAVGFILFYVGFLLPEVDQRLIDLCNELEFPLICMPKGRLNIRYSEIIGEIMFEVFRSRQRESYFVSDLLQRISDLPPHQRNIKALMRMLSDHLHASVILTDPFSQDHLCVCWPRALLDTIQDNLSKWLRKMEGLNSLQISLGDSIGHLQRCPVLFSDHGERCVYLLKYKDSLSEDVLWQTSELIRLFINIWSKNPQKMVTTEIVRAIINDDVGQMTRLSQLFNIDVSKLNQMWLFHPKDNSQQYSESIVREITEYFSSHYSLLLISYYEENLVVFTCAPDRYDQRQELLDNICPLLAQPCANYDIVCYDCLQTTKSVRNAYLDSVACLDAARKIYPEKLVMRSSDILFARQCCALLGDRERLQQYLDILNQLQTANPVLISTLETYLLDTPSNMAQTAKLLFVHLNTIKYRLHIAQDLLGYVPSQMPDAYPLYMAVSLNRLLRE